MRHIRQNNSWNVLLGLFLPESGQMDQTTVFKVKDDGETATFYVHHVWKLQGPFILQKSFGTAWIKMVRAPKNIARIPRLHILFSATK